jgi:hypothetical protein
LDRILKKNIFILFIFIVNIEGSPSLSIDEQIAIIKEAPESQRVELMNQFKRQLVLMNQVERERAIKQLKNNQQNNQPSSPISIPNQAHNLIQNLQESHIEQQSQIIQIFHIKELIQESNLPEIEQPINHTEPNIPNIEPQHPNNNIPNIEDMPNRENIPNPSPRQEEMPIETPSTIQPEISYPEVPQPEIVQPEVPNSNTSPIEGYPQPTPMQPIRENLHQKTPIPKGSF